MTASDRRRRAATLILAAALAGPLAAATAVPPAPVARVEPVKDTYFGETLTDPYRWMEDSRDRDWLPYLKGQNTHARAVLDSLPARAGLLARIAAVSGDTVSTSQLQRAAGLTFYTQRPAGADNYQLFVRAADGATRVLIDPARASGPTSHLSIDWWSASPDGRHVVYGLSRDGSEDSTLHVLQVSDGKDLPERIDHTENAGPQWLDDGSGFFYNQLTGGVNTPERYLDSQARFHRLGTDATQDPVLMKRGLVAGVDYDRIQMPYVVTVPGARYAVLMLRDVRPEFRAYLAPVAEAASGHATWREAVRFEDEVTDLDLQGEDLLLVANRGAPRGRLVRTPADRPDLAHAQVVVDQASGALEGLTRARDGLYLSYQDGGVSRLRRLGNDGQLSDVTWGFDATLSALAASRREDGVLLALSTWLRLTTIFAVNAAGQLHDTGINPHRDIDVSRYATTRAFATAKDGVRIPYTLIYRKDLKRDGSAPAFISAYGSYGAAAYTPAFAGRSLAFVDAGGIVGYAGVRGGGEYGRQWHRAGQLENKPNTWRDLVAVCETLIGEHWTSPPHLAIGGRSAGGITVGRALTERPDLFAAVIDGVGWSNPLRYVVEQSGYGEEPEWGAINDPAGYRALKSIDSYQAVRDGVKYPAVLLTTGVTDPRVAPFHVAKMAARLQAASTSGKPVLLRVDYDAGHGIGSTRGQQDREAADTYAFLLWQLKGEGPAG